jgi:hypothetical protein
VAGEVVGALPEAAAGLPEAAVHEAAPDLAAGDAPARIERHHLAGLAAVTGRVAETV